VPCVCSPLLIQYFELGTNTEKVFMRFLIRYHDFLYLHDLNIDFDLCEIFDKMEIEQETEGRFI
jgi:hypothetical protein